MGSSFAAMSPKEFVAAPQTTLRGDKSDLGSETDN